jgi:hypothetical protein
MVSHTMYIFPLSIRPINRPSAVHMFRFTSPGLLTLKCGWSIDQQETVDDHVRKEGRLAVVVLLIGLHYTSVP